MPARFSLIMILKLDKLSFFNEFVKTISFVPAGWHSFLSGSEKARFSLHSPLFASSYSSTYKDSVEAACLNIARKDLNS